MRGDFLAERLVKVIDGSTAARERPLQRAGRETLGVIVKNEKCCGHLRQTWNSLPAHSGGTAAGHWHTLSSVLPGERFDANGLRVETVSSGGTAAEYHTAFWIN